MAAAEVGRRTLATELCGLLHCGASQQCKAKFFTNIKKFFTQFFIFQVTLWEGRDACGNDGWSVEDVNSFRNNDQINQPLTKLEPYTQYAYYVKAYTLATEQKGAQSEIKYFTTKPDQPQRVRKLKATPVGHDKIVSSKTYN